jgi:hypothetical protein
MATVLVRTAGTGLCTGHIELSHIYGKSITYYTLSSVTILSVPKAHDLPAIF